MAASPVFRARTDLLETARPKAIDCARWSTREPSRKRCTRQPLRQLPLPHDPRSISKGDLVRWPLQAGGLERGDRNGQRVDHGEVQLELAADPVPDLDRVGDARRQRRYLLGGRRRASRCSRRRSSRPVDECEWPPISAVRPSVCGGIAVGSEQAAQPGCSRHLACSIAGHLALSLSESVRASASSFCRFAGTLSPCQSRSSSQASRASISRGSLLRSAAG